MKKILSLVLVVAMMASLVALAPTASAASGYSLEVTDAVASKGDTVTLNYIVDGGDLRSFQLLFDIDESRLENPVITVNTADNLSAAKPVGGFEYADATVVSAVDGDTIDTTGGYLLGTITVTVKEKAPAGDAYVRIAPVPGANIYLAPTKDANDKVYDWTVIDGNVTVLPEGYSAPAPESPASDFTYTNNADGTSVTITAYKGTDTVVSIPSVIDGKTVTGIGTAIFHAANHSSVSNTTITKVIIPATVTTIADYAMIALDACTTIEVYAMNATYGTAALGWTGNLTWNQSGNAFIGITYSLSVANAYITRNMTDAAFPAVTTIYYYDGASITTDDFATQSDAAFFEGIGMASTASTPKLVAMDAANNVTIVAGEDSSTYLVSGTSITAPGAARVDGKTTVAWKMGDKVVAPGATVAIDGDTTFEAITVAAPETTWGASVKAAENTAGLRFTAELSVTEYDALVTAFGAKNVKHGMIISTQKNIEKAGAFTHAALGAAVIDFEMTGCWKIVDGNYILAASVKNFSNSTLANNYAFNAVAYIAVDVDADGDTDTYVYGDYDWTCARDAKTILTKALSDYDNESQEYGWINTWIGYFDAGKKD